MNVGSSDKDAGQPRPVYSRRTPSPQYQVLVDFYQRMHSDGYNQIQQGAVFKKEGQDAFSGKKTLQFASQIKDLFQRNGVKACLDYGAGKASHYFDSVLITDKASGTEFNGLKAYWGIEEVTTWEPGLDNDGPKGIYDGAICVDVLEHCYAADLSLDLGGNILPRSQVRFPKCCVLSSISVAPEWRKPSYLGAECGMVEWSYLSNFSEVSID